MNGWPHFTENAWGTGLQAWVDPGVQMVLSVIYLCPSLRSALFRAGFVLRQVSLHPSKLTLLAERERESTLSSNVFRSSRADAHCHWSALLDYVPVPESFAAVGRLWYSRPFLKPHGQRMGNGSFLKEKSGLMISLPEEETGGAGKQNEQGLMLHPTESASGAALYS